MRWRESGLGRPGDATVRLQPYRCNFWRVGSSSRPVVSVLHHFLPEKLDICEIYSTRFVPEVRLRLPPARFACHVRRSNCGRGVEPPRPGQSGNSAVFGEYSVCAIVSDAVRQILPSLVGRRRLRPSRFCSIPGSAGQPRTSNTNEFSPDSGFLTDFPTCSDSPFRVCKTVPGLLFGTTMPVRTCRL